MRVLLVDDSKVMRNIQRKILAGLGWEEITEAADGAEALECIASHAPELILLDWNMPVMDGLEFLKKLRSAGNKTPVIMVTTEAEKSRVITAVQAGANNYMIKPFTADQLKERIEQTLKRHAA